MRTFHKFVLVSGILIGILAATGCNSNQEASEASAAPRGNGGELPLVRVRTTAAANALRTNLQQVPVHLLRAARCVSVVSKDQIGWGLSGGELGGGLVSCRTSSGQWSAPSYLSLGGITLGPSVGFLTSDTTFLYAGADARQVPSPNFTFNAGVYAIAGSARVEASVATDGCFTLRIANEHRRHCTLAITQEIGLAAGANVRGVLLRHMSGVFGGGLAGRNARVYGPGFSVQSILNMPGSSAPEVTQSWVEALQSNYATADAGGETLEIPVTIEGEPSKTDGKGLDQNAGGQVQAENGEKPFTTETFATTTY